MAEQTSRLAIILDSLGAQKSSESLASALGRLTQQGERASDSTDNLSVSFKRLATSAAGALSIGVVVKTVDEWGQVAARIKNALKSVEGDIKNYSMLQERFLEISNRNGKNIADTQLLYIGAATSMQELGYSTTQTVDYIESLSSSMTANASSVNEVLSMQNALNKAMVAGKVAGENWNSIMNATPTLLGDIAKELEKQNGGIKVTEMEVKKLAADGKISFKLFADAVMAAKDANNALADSMDNTVADGFTRVTNSAKAYYGEMNQNLGITRSISAGLAILSDNFGSVSTVLTGIIGIGAARYFGGLSTSIFLTTKDVISNTAATYANAAAQSRLAAAASLAKGALGLVGGPAGAAMLAAGAIFYFYQKAEQAKEEAMALADKVDQLRGSFNKLNTTQLKGVIADSADSLEILNDELEASNNLIAGRELEYKKIETSLIHFGNREQDLAKKRREIDQQRRVSADLEAKIANVTRLSADAVNELNSRLSEGKAIFEASTAKGNSLAQTVGLMAAKFREAADAKAALDNQMSSKPLDSSDAAAYLKQLEQQNELLNIQDLRKRAIRKALMDAEKNGASPGQIASIEAAAGKYFDLSKAESDRLKLLNKTSTYSESAAQKRLSNLQEQNAALKLQSEISDKLGTQQQALVKWNQEIKDIEDKQAKGKLTTDQKSLLANKALITAELERAAEYEKIIQRKEAEVKIAAYNKQLMEETAQAQRAYNIELQGAGIGNLARSRLQERLRLEEEYQKKHAALTAQYNDASSGITQEMYEKETQIIKGELDKRILMMQGYHAEQDSLRQNWQIGAQEALRNYIDSSKDYSQQANDIITNNLNTLTDGLSNSFTNMLTGTQSFTESLRNMSADLAKSIINDLIKIAIQAAITNSLTGFFGGGSGGSVSIFNAGLKGLGFANGGLVEGFAGGGYTGKGGKYDPRGVVHAGEFVFTKEATEKIGVPNLYKMMNTGSIPMDALKNDQYAMKNIHPANQTTNNSNEESNTQIIHVNPAPITVNGNPDDRTIAQLQATQKQAVKQAINEMTDQLERARGKFGKTMHGLYPNRKLKN
ncbi:phage tail tape measure protein [Providencia sp. R33]|uniref:phage tail tape measure protein n=1 Tax=Providencia sp. R33 TaxID=2828763 RepID=UPI001C5B6ED8|nr:phage tail tape measure protein [Providencia sp. R33]QXX82960.1 phage tail tape measure protein [Providencia sp. R33]